MTNAVRVQERVKETGFEVIDSLCFTIQRQSATCLDLVKDAVFMERERCASLAEAEAALLAARSDGPGSRVAQRIADRIRAHAG
jgi:hypothetical protein